MSVIIFNGSLSNQFSLFPIQNVLEHEVEAIGMKFDSYLLHQIEIKSCIGCFRCWDTTPGICSGVKGDKGEEIKKKVVNSDLLVFLSPITFGGYSSEIKKIFERLLGILQPGMQIINGESHHLKRYDRYPSILAIGVNKQHEQETEELFKTLVYRNSLNFYPPKYWTIIFQESDGEEIIRPSISKIIKQLEVNQ